MRRRRPAPMSAALKKLGDRLREARLAAGISQAQLGAPYFTRAHVSAIELGKIRPAMRSLEHMARKLDKPASYFLDDADAERARKEHELEVGSIAGLLTFAGARRISESRRRRPPTTSARSSGPARSATLDASPSFIRGLATRTARSAIRTRRPGITRRLSRPPSSPKTS